MICKPRKQLVIVFNYFLLEQCQIGHFRVPLCLCFKMSHKYKTILMKMNFICMKMKLHAELIFIWKVSHLDSFWSRGTRELGNGYFVWHPQILSEIFECFIVSCVAEDCRVLSQYDLHHGSFLLVTPIVMSSCKSTSTRCKSMSLRWCAVLSKLCSYAIQRPCCVASVPPISSYNVTFFPEPLISLYRFMTRQFGSDPVPLLSLYIDWHFTLLMIRWFLISDWWNICQTSDNASWSCYRCDW